MSEDVEKPLTGADADAHPTKPTSESPTADAVGATDRRASQDEFEENVGGVQGTPGDTDDDAGDLQAPPIDAPMRQPDVGGGEIEWTELGREAAPRADNGEDDA